MATTTTTITQTLTVSKDVTSIELAGTQIRSKLKALATARKMERAAKAAVEDAKEAVYALLNDAKVGTIKGEPVVEVQRIPRSDPDRKLLLQAFPEAYDAVMKDTSYDKIVIL